MAVIHVYIQHLFSLHRIGDAGEIWLAEGLTLVGESTSRMTVRATVLVFLLTLGACALSDQRAPCTLHQLVSEAAKAGSSRTASWSISTSKSSCLGEASNITSSPGLPTSVAGNLTLLRGQDGPPIDLENAATSIINVNGELPAPVQVLLCDVQLHRARR